MTNKPRSYAVYYITFITVSLLLFGFPAFAQMPKQKIVKTSATKNQPAPVKMLKTVDTATAYQIWFNWYQSQYQGKATATPTLTIRNVDEQEGKRIQAIWKQAQVKAERDFYRQLKQSGQTEQAQINMLPKVDMKTAYKIWFDWYQAQKQGIQQPVPSLKVRNASEKDVKRITAIWNNAQRKAEIDVQNQPAQVNQSNSQWVTTFYVKDAQGSTRALTDANGNVTDTFDYDAYGNLINRTGNTPNTRLYAGEEFDQDLGFYYLRARFLDTVKGRFITQDTFEESLFSTSNRHKYNYVSNNPVNTIDPSGHFGISQAAVGFSFINTIANSSTLSLDRTVAAAQDASQIETLRLNIVYESISQGGTRIKYSDTEKQDIINNFAYFANFGFGNIDIKFRITETDGEAEKLYSADRQIKVGYLDGALNAFFTKRGDPSPSPGVTTDNGTFINSKSDVKNLLHELIHQLGVRTGKNGYTQFTAEFGLNGAIAVERSLLSGRQDYTLPPLSNNIFYKLRLWGAEKYAVPPTTPNR